MCMICQKKKKKENSKTQHRLFTGGVSLEKIKMKKSNKISEYMSKREKVFSLDWEEVFDLEAISKDYIAQGIIKYKDYIIFSIHKKEQKSIIIFFKDNGKKLEYINEIEMPLEATHTSDLTIYNDQLYAMDFYSNFIYKFNISEVENKIKIDFIDKAKINLDGRSFGSFGIIKKEEIVYLVATSFLGDNRIWVFDFNDLFIKKLGFEDSLVFETEGSFYTQGIYYQKNNDSLFVSVNRLGVDLIFKINFSDFILNKDVNKAIEKTFLAPGRMIEDIYADDDFIYTSDEETNKIYKASLRNQSEKIFKKNVDLKKYKFYDKLLSHRNRINNFQDNTLDGFISVLGTGIKYIELDIRISADNVYFVYHDSFFKDGFRKFRFYDKTLNEINRERYKNNKIRISTLESILRHFSKYKKDEQIIALDIKDFGEEEELVRLVEKYNLLNSVIIFTWTPQVILKLDNIFENKKIKIPIYFSHVRTDSIFKYIFVPQFLNWKKYFLVFADFVLIGNHNYKTELGKYARGYRHVPYFFDLPSELIEILKKYNGGICVSTKSRTFPEFGIKYFQKMKNLGLNTTVFGPFFGELRINKKKYFENLAEREEIDIIFMDELDEML